MNTTERNITINAEQSLYVIHHSDHITTLGFDVCLRNIESYCIELAGRGALPDEYIEAPVKVKRGSIGAYDTMVILQKLTGDAAEAQGEQAVAHLSPQLMGLEGHRVEVETTYGETRRFIVGRSTGRMPCHLEIARRDSSGGIAAEHEYESVRDLGRVR